MPDRNQTSNMALFCDFENIALGVRDAKYDDLDITRVLERLLLKGSIVVKKAYADWERYKTFKRGMHEAAFELIDIPHVRQSGKNSADIRLVVDARSTCATPSRHVDTFVIISGRFGLLAPGEQAPGERQDGGRARGQEFDLGSAAGELRRVHLLRRSGARARGAQEETPPGAHEEKKTNGKAATKVEEEESDPGGRVDLVLETVEALMRERGENETLWGSMVKQALRRRDPGFNESALRLSLLQPAAGGGERAPAARAGSRREVGRLRDQVHAARRLKSGKRRQGGPAARGCGARRSRATSAASSSTIRSPLSYIILAASAVAACFTWRLESLRPALPPRHLPAQLPPAAGRVSRERAPCTSWGGAGHSRPRFDVPIPRVARPSTIFTAAVTPSTTGNRQLLGERTGHVHHARAAEHDGFTAVPRRGRGGPRTGAGRGRPTPRPPARAPGSRKRGPCGRDPRIRSAARDARWPARSGARVVTTVKLPETMDAHLHRRLAESR